MSILNGTFRPFFVLISILKHLLFSIDNFFCRNFLALTKSAIAAFLDRVQCGIAFLDTHAPIGRIRSLIKCADISMRLIVLIASRQCVATWCEEVIR